MNNILLSIGGINIYWYSALIIIAIIIGICIVNREIKRSDINKSFIFDLIFYLIPVAIIGGRIYYVIFNFSAFENDLLEIFRIWHGGLAIYGSIIASIIFILYYCHRREQPIMPILDVLVGPLILGQAIGRWGNFFNQEAYGSVTTLAFLQKLKIPNFITQGMYIDGVYYHPTFLYESLWCLLGFILLYIIRRRYWSKKGTVTSVYFIWYGIGRFFIESLRMDSLYLGKIRISQVVSIILVVLGIVGLIINIIKIRKEARANVKL